MFGDRISIRASITGFLSWAGVPALAALLSSWIAQPSRSAMIVWVCAIVLAGLAGIWHADRSLRHIRTALRRMEASYRRQPIRIDNVDEALQLALERESTAVAERDQAITNQQFVAARLEAIVTGLRDGVLIVDTELAIISINPAACAQLLTTRQQAIGRPLVEIARDYDVVRIASESLDQGTEQAIPIDFRRGGRQFNVRVTPIQGTGQRLAVLVVQDVTETRQLESVRKDFVANVSHELRTPLASIRALVETLADGALDDPEVSYTFLHRVVNEVDRLNELIEDLLDLGRLESGRLPLKRSPVQVSHLVADAVDRVRLQASEAHVRIETEVAPDLPELLVDISRIEQVMVNLLTNAIKFSPTNAVVRVEASRAGGNVLVAVQDTGEGILPEDLPRIFERFYKSDRARNSGGTGLGLAIAKHIILAHGGAVTAESEFDKGSTFTLQLPIAVEIDDGPNRPLVELASA